MTPAANAGLSKVLVANRGEIARRVFATCRRMGIASVAIYSEPDRQAPFVAEADEGVALGGHSPSESYLRGDVIIEAALGSGASAVHPGYGFLAENADFARLVIDAGLIWIGPPPEAIETMGSKLASKQLMEKAGVPTLTGVDLTGLSQDEVVKAAAGVGYPVLLKASAGGGGKGMRIVRDPAALESALEGARRESAAAFGDDTIFVEKYLDSPRHIEIQVMADSHGNTVALFERECSIQRRHQKIIEEAPSPAIDEATRTEMSEAAVRAAEAVAYRGAGTVEFLYQDGRFHFLEMNTRLQVEHPVTEMITGLDLVRLQLLVATGQALPAEALTASIRGHAVEARLYAEDATNDFLPVTGVIHRIVFPALEGLRVDSGVESGSEVTVHYDPLLAKVVAWAPTRTEAAALLARGLEKAAIHGSVTNRDLLVRVLRHPEFLAGDIDTHFLDRHDAAHLGRPLVSRDDEHRAAIAAAIASQEGHRRAAPVLDTIPSGWRNVASQLQTVTYTGSSGEIEVGYRIGRGGTLEVGGFGDARLLHSEPDRVGLELDGALGWFDVHRVGERVYVDGPAGPVSLIEHSRFPVVEADEEPGSLHAPMPGRVIRVTVAEGDEVAEGQVLVVLEAMKMEHTLRAPHPGRVTAVMTGPDDQVSAGAVLVVVGEQ